MPGGVRIGSSVPVSAQEKPDIASSYIVISEYNKGRRKKFTVLLSDLTEMMGPTGDVNISDVTGLQNELKRISDKTSVTPEDFGWTGADQGEDNLALLAWAESDFYKKVIEGSYHTTAELLFNDNLSVIGNGEITGSVGATDFVVAQRGTLTDIGACSIDKFSRTLTCVNTTGLASGDWLSIYNHADYSHNAQRDYYRAGEHVQIHSVVDQTTLTLTARAHYDYPSGGATKLYKFGMHKIRWDGPTVRAITGNGAAQLMKSHISINSGKFQGGVSVALSVGACVNPHINASCIITHGAAGTQYGLALAGVVGHRVYGTYYGTRHPIAHGGYSGPGNVPNRDGVISAYMANDPTLNLPAADIHSNSENITWDGCQINGGATLGGLGCRIINSEIHSPDEYSAFNLTGTLGGRYTIDKCTIYLHSSNQGCLIDGGVTSLMMVELASTPLNIAITRSSVYCQHAADNPAIYYVWIRQRGITPPTKVTLDDIDFYGNPSQTLFIGSSVADTPVTDPVVNVKDIRRFDGLSWNATTLVHGWTGAAGNRDF